ncbi:MULTISPECIES: hypothetical protein [unclassified Clostridium]|uniref:hypothetical protein n=1 Tax=unclassified Clostridium TaxID=2614128 RepID=UPI00207A6779|nr:MULTISPECIES: hypothetical protein [unclassified Clostridium]
MRDYIDKNNKIVQDEDFVLVENEKVCQALRCDDGTLLYEELILDNDELDLSNEPNYPDAYKKDEIEVITRDKAIQLLRKY